jgi:alpha-tubulin suppressor-like RCC1 family protein
VSLATGSFHSCALQANGQVACWGSNASGQIGTGATASAVLAPFATSVTDAVAIVAGTAHTCALRVGGTVRCWGAGTSGQLGDGQLVSNPSPVQPSGLGANIVAIGAGRLHTCALRFDGGLRCWGRNEFGQIGDGTVVDRATQRTVSGPSNFVAMELGDEHSCGIRVDGTLSCWGANDRGQIGNGTTDTALAPTLVSNLSQIRAVSGGGDTTCAIGIMSPGGAVARGCWGRNDFGQTGFGKADRLVPLLASAPTGIANISVGFTHACDMRREGIPACWGRNTLGQIGQGTFTATEQTREVPSFALNLLSTGQVTSVGHRAVVTVVANCADGAQAKLDVTVRQGAVTATGKGLGHCTGALELFEVAVHTKGGQSLAPGATLATAVARIRDGSELLDTVEWSRQVALGN